MRQGLILVKHAKDVSVDEALDYVGPWTVGKHYRVT